MVNWKAHLHEILGGLSRTHANEPLVEIQRVLRGVLNVEDIRFHDRDGHELRPDLPLQQAMEQSCQVVVRLQCKPAAAPPAPEPARRPAESRFREGAPPLDKAALSTDERYELFLREFLRLEERHEFMWAGYIVRELLPRLGFAADEAKLVLDHLRAENLVTITKVANPKNPDFPATGVQLNHEHPRVKALLGERLVAERAPAPAPQEPTPPANP